MGIIDLFRPKWRHSDAEVRAEAVRALGSNQLDARVRRIAVKRLDDPRVLADIAARDPDEGIRELATGQLVATACADSAEAEGALARLTAAREIGEVARRAARGAVRAQAVARLGDGRILAEVVRRARAKAARAAAKERLPPEEKSAAPAATGPARAPDKTKRARLMQLAVS